MNKNIIASLLLVFSFNCREKQNNNFRVGFEWENVSYLELDSKWYVCFYIGAKNFLKEDDFTKSAVDIENIYVGNAYATFDYSTRKTQNYTIVTFNDSNNNGYFDINDKNFEYETVSANPGDNSFASLKLKY